MNKNKNLFQKENSALLIIDIQEKLLPVILGHQRLIENTLKLINGFKTLNVPIFYTEQYAKGLGSTEPNIKLALKNISPIDKTTFSCCGNDNFLTSLKQNNIERIAVCGVESHICVLQSTLDLIANGFKVHIAADAVSSRRQFDLDIALKRMENNGAQISLTESILFEILDISGTDEFRAISKIVK
jgi:nicotinamidase-related amidase